MIRSCIHFNPLSLFEDVLSRPSFSFINPLSTLSYISEVTAFLILHPRFPILKMWDPGSGFLLGSYEDNPVGATGLCISGTHLVVARLNGCLEFLDVVTHHSIHINQAMFYDYLAGDHRGKDLCSLYILFPVIWPWGGNSVEVSRRSANTKPPGIQSAAKCLEMRGSVSVTSCAKCCKFWKILENEIYTWMEMPHNKLSFGICMT